MPLQDGASVRGRGKRDSACSESKHPACGKMKTLNPHAAKAKTRHAETTKAAGLVPRQLLSYIFSLYWRVGLIITCRYIRRLRARLRRLRRMKRERKGRLRLCRARLRFRSAQEESLFLRSAGRTRNQEFPW